MITILKKHHRMIILTVPIIFLMASSDFVPKDNGVFLKPSNYFPEVGVPFSINIDYSSNTLFNATDGTITFAPGSIEVLKIDISNTSINLWGATPEWSNNNGVITWSGGIISPTFKNNRQEGNILKVIAIADKPSLTYISIKDASLLAADGTAKNIIQSVGSIKIYPHPKGSPTPDIDSDGKITAKDISYVIGGVGKKYNQKYDINNDKVVSHKDVTKMISYYNELNK